MSSARRILRHLFSREGIASVLLVVMASLVCVGLGLWQEHRFETKHHRAQVVEQNFSAEPVDVSQVLPDLDTPLAADDDWKQVRLSGHYCTSEDCILWVRNRAFNGRTGFLQMVPFVTEHGTLLVVRGWVDTKETTSQPESDPPVPEGRATIVARLRPVEQPLKGRTNPSGQVQTITPTQLPGILPDQAGPLMTGAYGNVVTEDPSVSPMPYPVDAPDTDLGPHLSYWFQWWLFALMFPVGLVLRTRKQLADDDAADHAEVADTDQEPSSDPDPGPGAAAPQRSTSTGTSGLAGRYGGRGSSPNPSRRSARRATIDEEEEDALVDERHR
jgi:cytochrome oxidase assembly protein ShyY1